jgi:GGDEF domain-containing protein
VRLERENEKLTQLIRMLQLTRTLMREAEAGHLLNMVLNTLSRIVGNNRLALFPTTVLGEHRTFIRHVDSVEAGSLHELVLKHLDPRSDMKVQGRQACSDIAEVYPDQEYSSFARVTPWVLRDAGRTYLGMLYLFDNDPAQEDTLSHAVIRTIVVELEHTLRRYLLEDATAHAISELPYRIWSREYWLRRFEEEINLTGRRGTRVTSGILTVVNYDELLEEMDDLILKESILTFIQVIKASVRETDLICRLDRSHFGVLFLDAAKSKVMPALERISTQIQRVVGGSALAPRINFVAGLAEFPWDGESVPTLMRKTWTAAAVARSKGTYVLQPYDHDEAQAFLKRHEEVREEISVHLELLGDLELADVTATPSASPPEER